MGLLISVAIVVVVLLYVTSIGGDRVWRTVLKHPGVLIGVIESSGVFRITKRGDVVIDEPPGAGWEGPFSFILPGEGKVEFYGQADAYYKMLSILADVINEGNIDENYVWTAARVKRG